MTDLRHAVRGDRLQPLPIIDGDAMDPEPFGQFLDPARTFDESIYVHGGNVGLSYLPRQLALSGNPTPGRTPLRQCQGMPTLTPLAMKIRKLRTARGLNQVEVAAAVSLSRGAYAMIETGADTPGREAEIKIADFFGVSLDWLEDRLDKVTAPDAGQVVKDPGEIGLLHFWRGLSADQKILMTKMLGNLSPNSVTAA